LRLTHLKLAGFKSFVDSTTLHIHGQRVGIVGPNGCGKSNVMESVRWVLGESSAKEMRGDSMDAVIFNGSGNRKPISRASVELIFDNSLGSAAGEWSQYAEISVKRMIERDKGSTYYINNTVVRRRDVADLFLGTGLGGRAYAIIGQNTINRIVEAKPEELRIFLEEAAGISKYKERRRETELRLRDTRENLVRVEDILRELDKQIVRLQSQAVVAAQYRHLQEVLHLTKGQIWLLKKREASERWQATQRLVEKLQHDLETQIATLRHNESALETTRQAHFDATDAMNLAQANYYEANAEVSNLENQVKNLNDANERMKLQLQQYQQQIEKNSTQRQTVEASQQAALEQQKNLEQDYGQTEVAITSARENVGMTKQSFHSVLATFNQCQADLMNAEQRLRIAQTSESHMQKTLREAQAELVRLEQQLNQIEIPSNSVIEEKQNQRTMMEVELASLEKSSQAHAQDEHAIQDALKESRELYQSQQKTLHMLEAEIDSLNKIQQSIRSAQHEQGLKAWLKETLLDDKQRVWQTLKIKSGWETALEAILGGKLNAIVQDVASQYKRPPNKRPPSALSLVNASQINNTNKSTPENQDKVPLFSLIEHIDPQTQAAIFDWLTGVYVIANDADAIALCQTLKNGEVFVNQQGDVYSQHSVTYFGPQNSLHGVLERQAALEALETQLPDMRAQVVMRKNATESLEQRLQALRSEQKALEQQLKMATQNVHQLHLSLQQLKQQQQNAIARKTSIENDCANTQQKLQIVEVECSTQQTLLHDIHLEINQCRAAKASAETQKQSAETALNAARQHLQNLEKAYQEKSFSIKLVHNSLNDLNEKLTYLAEENGTLNARFEELNQALLASNVQDVMQKLEVSLNTKQALEQALASARSQQSETETSLQTLERERMKNEQSLHPLRDKLEASRLNEQEARLHFEQCQIELQSANLSETVLAEQTHLLEGDSDNNTQKIKALEAKKNKVSQEIEALGAVNLAAIEELATEEARRNLLHQQSEDLIEASETLENAIRKIDKETRGRLQATFDEANLHFGQLFTTLFGGGQARLELLGEEILDTGMQVFAQPPGKKNSTIHLLSGGEKALTALALVFALFKLNPAPFCLMDEVDAPLDDSNTERFCAMVKQMSEKTQFLYVSHNKITMEMAQQLIGVTMQESGVSRIVDVDMEAAVRLVEESVV
jgi:chromosome segregation protein